MAGIKDTLEFDVKSIDIKSMIQIVESEWNYVDQILMIDQKKLRRSYVI